MTTTRVEPGRRVRGYKDVIDEADMQARFLLADIQALLDRIPDSAIPNLNRHLELALRSAKGALAERKVGEAKGGSE